MKYDKIDNALFKANRERFIGKMKPGSIAIFHSNDEMPTNGDGLFPFKQSSDLFYLSGVDQEDSILVLFPDAPQAKHREMLFVKETNEYIKVWHGHKLTKDEATEVSGIAQVYWTDQFESIVPMLMSFANNCYLNSNENDRASADVLNKDQRKAIEWRNRFPLHEYERSAPIMHELRSIKSEIEISQMRKAIEITGKAFNRVLEFVEPGVWEHEVEAEVLHQFLKNRATGFAYYPIIASGASACILHYNENNRECKDGDLLLMDFGAEYANYCADLTRTIPVSGRFTDRQKAVYNAVLRVMKEAKLLFRPGTSLNDINMEAGKLMEKELLGLGLISQTDIDNQNPDMPAFKKYFMHGLGHFIGLDTHDVGNRYAAIQPGMTFTNEPGIYIPEEGIGIRIENDILVTDGDPVDLMDGFPIEVEEIEEAMNTSKVTN